MSIYNLIEYSDNYVKTSKSLWQYYIVEPSDNTTDSKSCKFKSGFKDKTDDTSTVDVKIVVSFELLWFNSEIDLILLWWENLVIFGINREAAFSRTETKHYGPVETFSVQDNKILAEQNNCNQGSDAQLTGINIKSNNTDTNTILRYLTWNNCSLFREWKKLFKHLQILQIEHHIVLFDPDLEIEYYNGIIDWRYFSDEPVNNKEKIYNNIQKNAND